jgi:hypothetical protein
LKQIGPLEGYHGQEHLPKPGKLEWGNGHAMLLGRGQNGLK